MNLQAKDILNHGLWIILHIVFIKKQLQYGENFSITEEEKLNLSFFLDVICQKLVDIVQAEQWGKTAQAIFENQTDCNTIKNRLMAALASA